MPVTTLLSLGRAAVGAAAWIDPARTARLLLLRRRAGPQHAYLIRLFAVRDLALAAGLQLSRGQSRRLWLQLGIVCDAADGVASVLAGRDRTLSGLSTAMVTAPALAGVGLGLAALQAQAREPAAAP